VRVFESDDGGATWSRRIQRRGRNQQGDPFVVTNQRSNVGANNVFRSLFGDVSISASAALHS